MVTHMANKFNLVGNKEFCGYPQLLSADGAARPSIALDVPSLLSSGERSWRTLLQPLLAAYRYCYKEQNKQTSQQRADTRVVPKVTSNFLLHANWEQQTKENAVVDGTSCCVILECLVTSIACIT